MEMFTDMNMTMCFGDYTMERQQITGIYEEEDTVNGTIKKSKDEMIAIYHLSILLEKNVKYTFQSER